MKQACYCTPVLFIQGQGDDPGYPFRFPAAYCWVGVAAMALRKRNISRPSAGKAAKKARMRSGRFALGVGRIGAADTP